MVLPRFPVRGRGGRGRPSIKDRIGHVTPVGVSLGTGGPRTRNSLSVHSRLGIRGGGAVRGRTVGGIRVQTSPIITDARQKINLNRVKSGRIADARQKIETKRVSQSLFTPLQSQGFGPSPSSMNTRNSFPPIKSLKITTSNSPPRQAAGLFRSAVSGVGPSPWGYSPPPPQQSHGSFHHSPPSAMLTRTISNPQARGYPPPPPPPFSSYGRPTGGSFYSTSVSSPGSRVSQSSRRDTSGRFRSDSWDEDDSMDMETTPPPSVRSSLQARLDIPKFKIKVSNLQSSVSTDDLMELFADVGDLITVKSVRSGEADVFYKTKGDCIKAIDAYHNRLLDGSPMKVVLHEDRPVARDTGRTSSSSGILSGLKSAAGSSGPIPKSNSNIKVHPDLSAIHKVLFQPTSSANAAKMLFKGAGH